MQFVWGVKQDSEATPCDAALVAPLRLMALCRFVSMKKEQVLKLVKKWA